MKVELGTFARERELAILKALKERPMRSAELRDDVLPKGQVLISALEDLQYYGLVKRISLGRTDSYGFPIIQYSLTEEGATFLDEVSDVT